MLVACRLAGLSALEPYYAGIRARAQCGADAGRPCAGPGRALARVSAGLRGALSARGGAGRHGRCWRRSFAARRSLNCIRPAPPRPLQRPRRLSGERDPGEPRRARDRVRARRAAARLPSRALAEELRSAAADPRWRRLWALRPLAPVDRRRGGHRGRDAGPYARPLSVVVEDGDAAVFIAGDASYTEEAMLAGRIDGVGADEGAERATLAAIRAFAASQPTIYLPAHDPDAARRLAGRRTTQAPPVMRPDGVAESGRAASLDVGAAAHALRAASTG